MKKTVLFFLVVLFFVSSCMIIRKPFLTTTTQYILTFADLSDLQKSRYGIGYTTDGSYLYAVNGGVYYVDSNKILYLSNIERYDIESDEWLELASGLIRKCYTSAEYVSNKIYVFNGYGPFFSEVQKRMVTKHYDQVEVVDLNTGSVSSSTRNPYPMHYAGSAVWNGKIYVFGGSKRENTQFSNRLYVFDPAMATWTRLSDMPEAKQTSGEIVDGVLYVFGGFKGNEKASSRIDAYDIQSDTWSFIGRMPNDVSAHATTKQNKLIWLIGDYRRLNNIAVFNTVSQEFRKIKSNIIGRRHAGAEIVDNKLYVFGGLQAPSYTTLSSTQVTDLNMIGSKLTLSQPDVKR